jgi:hypothetical protein
MKYSMHSSSNWTLKRVASVGDQDFRVSHWGVVATTEGVCNPKTTVTRAKANAKNLFMNVILQEKQKRGSHSEPLLLLGSYPTGKVPGTRYHFVHFEMTVPREVIVMIRNFTRSPGIMNGIAHDVE